jgi:hypothetical protein
MAKTQPRKQSAEISPFQIFTGYLLIFIGLALIILAVLVSLGVLEGQVPMNPTHAGWFDLLLALLEQAPWFGVVGVFLVYAGVKMIGVRLPI